jgi:streptogrisin C
MKRITVAAACALAAGATLSASCYANDPNWGGGLLLAASFGPQSRNSATAVPASVSSLVAQELAVLTNQGLSPGRALQALDVQAKVANASLPSRLQTAMGIDYAGVWFENAIAQLYVGVTSPSSRRAAEGVVARAGLAGVVTIVPVRSTMAQLLATQNQWKDKLADLFTRGVVETGIEPQRNAVSVRLGAAVPASRRAALKREAAAAPVNVFVAVAASASLSARDAAKECGNFTKGIANCNPSITAGVGIGSGGTTATCTAGPAAVPLANRSERVLLTAGHCIEGTVGAEWFAFNRNTTKLTIGKAIEFRNGGTTKADLLGDFGDIKIESTGGWQHPSATTPVLAVTAEWLLLEETRYKVKGELTPVAKATDCHEGVSSGQRCGEITMLDASTTVNSKVKEGLVEDTAKIEAGDSGGPWLFAEPEAAGFEALMEGTAVGEKGSTGNSVFEPLRQPEPAAARGSLEELNLELLTTANEVLPTGQWDVNGTKLVGYAPFLNSALVLSHGELVAAGVKVVCTGSTVGILFGELAQPDEVRAKDLTFTNCTASGESCSLANETILTSALRGLAQLDGTLNTLTLILPQTKTVLATIKFNGVTCALEGVQAITGRVDVLIDGGADPAVLHLILAFSLTGGLKLGSSEATLSGFGAHLRLQSGQTWNFL